MSSEFMLAVFLMAVGLSVAGSVTHLYQMVRQEPAILRFDGATSIGMFGHLLMSLVCGPYIMLRLGLNHEDGGTLSMTNVIVGSTVALGWAFITGLLFVGGYLAIAG